MNWVREGLKMVRASFAMETKESHGELDVTANVINPNMDNPSAEAAWMKV